MGTILLVLLIILIAGSNLCFTSSENLPKIIIGREISNKTEISLQKGERFIILLETRLSTGYDWEIKQPIPECIQIIEDFILYKEVKKPEVGGYEFHLFKLKAKKRGSGILIFQYKRKWEKKSLKTREIKVYIK